VPALGATAHGNYQRCPGLRALGEPPRPADPARIGAQPPRTQRCRPRRPVISRRPRRTTPVLALCGAGASSRLSASSGQAGHRGRGPRPRTATAGRSVSSHRRPPSTPRARPFSKRHPVPRWRHRRGQPGRRPGRAAVPEGAGTSEPPAPQGHGNMDADTPPRLPSPGIALRPLTEPRAANELQGSRCGLVTRATAKREHQAWQSRG